MESVEKLRNDLNAMWIDVTVLEVMTRALMKVLVDTPAGAERVAEALETEVRGFGLMAFAGAELSGRTQAARAIIEEHVRQVRDDLRLCA
ncbi:hypothetical protein [Caulobacter sp. 17J65-9]|uniref:hypothetical protein n=1 Tax=Caulobacter sp. 17J65-9 TaxID=2709382 RepID=UPI0013C96BC9|nr:hypothetical protein [Caulobacter sp. 17J65-9]NEX95285.1 hypothetical protein [Caulobacter sp. 17J65-9]